ncbi:hypothetical protein A3K72_00680 [Candidatus Woesearchaeota archaeon RBG_13_36_6]|nr:MAG: hypothetical protein A3K72_00680 [Candidatus Woesearchaeota archaeon RBG_13_36_6]
MEEVMDCTEAKVVLAEIYKQGDAIFIAFPNQQDTKRYEVYGFLRLYLKKLEKSLLDEFEEFND